MRTVMPPSRRSKNVSRYQVISPRYSKSDGAVGSKVANSSPWGVALLVSQDDYGLGR
jgi:hypothetical protein